MIIKSSRSPPPSYFRFNIILTSIPGSSEQPLSDFPIKTLYALLVCPKRSTCAASHIFLNLITRIM
jgi:hypothetical protein